MKKGVDYIGVGVGAVIFNNEGKIFLAKRGFKSRNQPGKWDMPGGGLRFGETFEDAIKREMKEEFGIGIELIEQLETFNHLVPEEKQHWLAICFIAKLKYGEPRILEPEKTDEIGWFSIEEIQKMDLTIVSAHRLHQILNKRPFNKTYFAQSKIKKAGRGIFAAVDIKNGEMIEIAPVLALSRKDYKLLKQTEMRNYYFMWGKVTCAVCFGIGSMCNHSYTPNATYKKKIKEQEVEFIAIKDIKKDEEITINYNYGNPDDKSKLWIETIPSTT